MEVKVIFVGVGVLVIWHLFSGKDDPEFDEQMYDEGLNRKLQDIRYSLSGYKNEWEAMKEKYHTNFNLYEQYWASGMQAARQERGELDEISDLLNRINDFRIKCRHDGVMKELVDSREQIESYDNESLDYVHRTCTIISKEIRSQMSAWNARLDVPLQNDPVLAPGAGLVGDADDFRLNLPFIAIEERPKFSHWTDKVSEYSKQSFSGHVKDILSQDDQEIEVRSAVLLSRKEGLASAVADVHGGDNAPTDQNNGFNVDPGDDRQNTRVEVLRDTNIQVANNPNQNEAGVVEPFTQANILQVRTNTDLEHPEDNRRVTVDAVNFDSSPEPVNNNIDLPPQDEAEVPQTGVSRENTVPVYTDEADLFQTAMTRENSPDIARSRESSVALDLTEEANEPIRPVLGMVRSASAIERLQARSPSPVLTQLPQPLPPVRKAEVTDLNPGKAKRRKQNPLISNVQAPNFDSEPARAVRRNAASADPDQGPVATQSTEQMWEAQRTAADKAFKSAYGKFSRLFTQPSEKGKSSTRKALQEYYKRMGAYSKKVAEITKNRLNDNMDLRKIQDMFSDAYQKLQTVAGARRVPPPAPIKGERRKVEKANAQLRKVGERAKRKRPNRNIPRKQVEANIEQGNPQVTRPRDTLYDEVIHLPNASPNNFPPAPLPPRRQD